MPSSRLPRTKCTSTNTFVSHHFNYCTFLVYFRSQELTNPDIVAQADKHKDAMVLSATIGKNAVCMHAYRHPTIPRSRARFNLLRFSVRLSAHGQPLLSVCSLWHIQIPSGVVAVVPWIVTSTRSFHFLFTQRSIYTRCGNVVMGQWFAPVMMVFGVMVVVSSSVGVV
jgi:hypothetical protein